MQDMILGNLIGLIMFTINIATLHSLRKSNKVSNRIVLDRCTIITVSSVKLIQRQTEDIDSNETSDFR